MTRPDSEPTLDELPPAQVEDDSPASDPLELAGDPVDDDLDGPEAEQ